MPRTLNDKEQNLVADLGVYGCWLIKNVKHLPRRTAIERQYNLYIEACAESMDVSDRASNLIEAIDYFLLRNPGKFPVHANYEEALDDLVNNG